MTSQVVEKKNKIKNLLLIDWCVDEVYDSSWFFISSLWRVRFWAIVSEPCISPKLGVKLTSRPKKATTVSASLLTSNSSCGSQQPSRVRNSSSSSVSGPSNKCKQPLTKILWVLKWQRAKHMSELRAQIIQQQMAMFENMTAILMGIVRQFQPAAQTMPPPARTPTPTICHPRPQGMHLSSWPLAVYHSNQFNQIILPVQVNNFAATNFTSQLSASLQWSPFSVQNSHNEGFVFRGELYKVNLSN